MDGVLEIPLKSSGYSFRAGYNLTDSHPAVGYHLFSPPGFATPHKRGWFRPSYCYRQIECSEQRVDFPVGFQLSSLRSIIDLPGRDRFHETDAGHLPDPRPFSRAPSTLLGNRSISNFDGSAGSSDENTRLEIFNATHCHTPPKPGNGYRMEPNPSIRKEIFLVLRAKGEVRSGIRTNWAIGPLLGAKSKTLVIYTWIHLMLTIPHHRCQ